MVAAQVARRSLMKQWFAIEAIPIYVILGGALSGASWYLYRLGTRPDIIWTRKNPEPWQSVKQNENTKFMAINREFDRKWTREKL
ncbi:SubName: Full=Uncharacterized protein {ECO:0000313/EMBL:CCA70470.1} [Serendipita indica DSM 11827]|uniref:NADH-ubiquinone oxidoreductase MLRQ subunit n=1 Tax=Serendipita indica (strain DSM 11827) TaxID=1109443 RepID=G4TGM2_SERID|nr:SubName: Full=Uncharacterized protein {ECO:0000313/EMBL:CCA70470.1} [Serendipita indica DSM 11827]CCA70470.1 hypothetical protein PIIN_04408 [Serendipita indica DSM 11827]